MVSLESNSSNEYHGRRHENAALNGSSITLSSLAPRHATDIIPTTAPPSSSNSSGAAAARLVHPISNSYTSSTSIASPSPQRRSQQQLDQQQQRLQQQLILQQAEEEAVTFADPETQAVSLIRLFILAVILLCMAVTATSVYFFTRNSELDLFYASFESDSNDVIKSVGETLYTSMGAVDAYLVSLVSMARATNQTWPFVSMPDASVRLAKLRSLSKAVSVVQTHFVTADEKEEWENYTATHNQWATEALRLQKTDKNYHGTAYESFQHKPTIRSYRGNSTGPGPFLPTWHSSPFVPALAAYNIDGMSYLRLQESLPELLGPKRVVIARVSNFVNQSDPVSVAEINSTNRYMKDFLLPDDDPTEPFSMMLFPIVDDHADYIARDFAPDKSGEGVRGVIAVYVYWRDLLRGVLPDETVGIFVVVKNTCGDVFTYEIQGSNVAFVEARDTHERAFDSIGESIKFDALVNQSATGQRYTGLPLGGELCSYSMSIYPSAKREKQFTSQRPLFFTIAAILIFIFCSALFLLYDLCVERRQRKIMYTAVQRSANVALLERMVSDRTRSMEDTNLRLEEANRRVTKASAAQLEHFACMSHEIRTPLNCIVGLSSLLLDTDLEPMQEESMRMIVTSGDLLLTVVNDVLDYAKLESGNVDIVPTQSNLQHTLSTVIQSIETKALPKKLTIRTVLDPLVGEFMEIDIRRLQQILFNLMGNAVKFSHPGGIVHLTVSLVHGTAPADSPSTNGQSEEVFRTETMVVRERSREFMKKRSSFTITSLRGSKTLTPSENVIRFSVKDCGKGIERKDFATIFQPFRQASAETERVYGGTGLGLAVTSRLVTSMGGTISVDSQVGEWAEFTVDLPYTDSPIDTGRLASRLSSRVVLIDDDVSTVEVIQKTFRLLSVEFLCYRTLSEMAMSTEKLRAVSRNQMCICLVNERLYDVKVYESVAATTRCVLFTHGPNFAVKESKGHYRSLTNVLPSVLIESFISVCDAVRLSRPGISPPSSPMKKKLVTVNPAETLRILIAEDNKINQKVLLKILERLNFKNVDVVDDGQQACQREFCVPYDIILMDVQMPIMNGIDACEEILGRASNHPKPKVIFITAHVSDAYEAACRAVGGADFLPKPVNVSDVDDCLRRNMPLLPAFPPPVQVVSADVSAEETTAPQRIDQPSAGATSVEEITAQQRIDQPPEAAISVEKTTALQRIDQPPEPATSVEETTAPRTIARPPEAATSVDRTADPQSNPTPVESDGGIPAMPRILIAEDNKINQKVLCKILQKLEYTDVDVVDDGKQACDKEFLQPYDLILMDIQMPVMNGIEACKVILGRSTTHPKPKIVFVTAHVSDEFESECDNAGGVDFLTKPVNIKTIQNCLRRHIAVVPVAEPVNAAPPSSRQAAITVPELLAPPATPPVRASGTPVIEKPEESPPAASLRILIAEDNKINQKVLMRILDRLGYKNVDVVDDGKQACDRELEKEYDIILMDIQMPVMDGIEACREILGRPSRHAKSPKVIFVTAHVSDAFAAECDAAGGVDFIAKPVNLADIDKCLRRHTHSAAAPSE